MDDFTRQWITAQAVDVLRDYQPGELTLRGLHYRLVARGMTNSIQHYKRVIGAMTAARWDGTVSFYAFSDHDRETHGVGEWRHTDLEDEQSNAEEQIKAWMNAYRKNRWGNQPEYVEVWIEKKALQGVFEPVCIKNAVLLAPCKGYASLTFLNEAADRLLEVQTTGKNVTLLYFGDYDPSGEDIPRSLQENLARLNCEIEVHRCLLLENQVVNWRLPPAPVKRTDSRAANWNGLGQVELDSVEPHKLRVEIQKYIDEYFDTDLHDDLIAEEEVEREQYRTHLKKFVQGL